MKRSTAPSLASLGLIAVFFGSGASALIFETLWFRLAGLAFGNSVWASALVLSSFMAGLAMGNGVLARFSRRVQRPLRLYALLEFFVAASGVLLVLGLPFLGGWTAPLFRPVADSPTVLNALRCGLAFVLLTAPATCMGMTLPLLVKALYARTAHFGHTLGRLYGWNTLGAVAGALLGESLLIDWLGMRGTGFAAGAINLAAATGALLLARRLEKSVEIHEQSAPEARFRFDGAVWRLLLAAFLAGGALLALEVVWFRFLRLFIQSTYMGFAIMLSVVLSGIGLGGVTAGALLGKGFAPERLARASSLGAGLFLMLGYAGFSHALGRYAEDEYLVALWRDMFFLSCFLMLPASFFSGALFTALGQHLHARALDAARTAGLLSLCNTLGAMLGPLLAGFVLLPALGVEKSFFLFALVYGGVALLLAQKPKAPLFKARGALAISAAYVATLALFPFGAMNNYLALAASKHDSFGFRQVAVREGVVDTIQYLRKDFLGKPYVYQLLTNGFSMSGTGLFAKRYMNDYVYFARAFKPEMRDCLLICFGVGNTAKAMTEDKGFERIDVVDISPDVLEMSKIVFDPIENPLNDTRVRTHIEDGRFFLQTTERRFDLITAEPPPLLSAGTVNLYTQEYFQLLRDRLREGGMTTYWLPVHQISQEETRAILKAFYNVFPNATIWAGKSLDWMLVGVRGDLNPVSQETFSLQWSAPRVGDMLRSIGFETPPLLLTTFLAGPEHIELLTRNVEPLTDNYPKRLHDVERYLGDSIAEYLAFEEVADARTRFMATLILRRWLSPDIPPAVESFFPIQEVVNKFFLVGGFQSPPLEALHVVLTKTELRDIALWLLNSDSIKLGILRQWLEEGNAPTPFAHYHLGAASLALRDYPKAGRHFEQSDDGRPESRALGRILQAYALLLAGDEAGAKKTLHAAPVIDETARNSFIKWAQPVFNVAL
jgi:predicted membrane-bound spermidine synthase